MLDMRAWICLFLVFLFFGCLGLGAVDNKAAAQAKCGAINATNINETYPAALGECHYDLADCARDFCYIDYANATRDPAVCDAVIPAVTDASASGANTIGKGNCYLTLIGHASDSAICEQKVNSTNWSNWCYAAFAERYAETAAETNDTSVCSKSENKELYDMCIVEAAERLCRPELCDVVFNRSQDRDDCYYNISVSMFFACQIQQKAQAVCDMIGNLDKRDQCYLQVVVDSSYAIAGSEYTICDMIGNLDKKDQCYLHVAIYNYTVCDKISSSDKRDDCYGDQYIGIGSKGISCNMVRNLNKKDECYSSAATNNRNSALCDKISNSSIKNECLQNSKS